MELVVVVDVHDKEEETAGQDDGATHEEKVLVVLEDVHQEPCREKKIKQAWKKASVYVLFDKTNVFSTTTDRTPHFLIQKRLRAQINPDLASAPL